jgi:hypothetical protein
MKHKMTNIVDIATGIRNLRRELKANREAIAELKKDNAKISKAIVQMEKVLDGDGKARIGLGKGGWLLHVDEKPRKKLTRKARRKPGRPKKKKAASEKQAQPQT